MLLYPMLVLCLLLHVVSPPLRADEITDNDIVMTPEKLVGSGNGTLDMLLLHDAVAGSSNESGDFNADDAFIRMPKGNSSDDACASYITSIGEIRQFYILNFSDNEGGSIVEELQIFLDLNQTTTDGFLLKRLTVVVDFDNDYGDDRDLPASRDISSATQALTDNDFSGGTVVAWLDSSPKPLPLNEQGGGYADYIILTGVNPFDPAFDNDTRILIHMWSTGHTDGGETLFLSGQFYLDPEPMPEPGSLLLVGTGVLIAVGVLRRRRIRS